jgi:hypothetical protein
MSEMYLPHMWKNDESMDKHYLDYLWDGDAFLKQVCAALNEASVYNWTKKPNTHFLLGALVESSLYLTDRDTCFGHPHLDVNVVPSYTDGKVRKIELTIVDKFSDKIHVYCLLTPTLDGWVWKDMIPNPIFQMLMR